MENWDPIHNARHINMQNSKTEMDLTGDGAVLPRTITNRNYRSGNVL